MTGNGKTINYKYNDSGIRTQKTVNNITTNYHLVGDKVTYEDNGTDKIYYTYDSSDSLVSMNLNNVEYYYIRNAQGDIIGLFDNTGKQVASYTYDSWGKLISIKDGSGADITNNTGSVGYKNPYRYRGYRYDTETGLYYLQSRYYNPEWGRFISVDGIVGTPGELLSANMFAYCTNNPINMIDSSGKFPFALSFLSEAIVATVEAVATVLSAPVVMGSALIVATGLLIYSEYQYYKSRHISYSDVSAGSSEKEYENSKSNGAPTKDHTVVSHNPESKPVNKNPNKSKPNSSSDLLNEDGSVKQRRYYDSDGKPDFDIDFNHQGEETHVFPHSHTWDWSKTPPRLKWEPWKPTN